MFQKQEFLSKWPSTENDLTYCSCMLQEAAGSSKGFQGRLINLLLSVYGNVQESSFLHWRMFLLILITIHRSESGIAHTVSFVKKKNRSLVFANLLAFCPLSDSNWNKCLSYFSAWWKASYWLYSWSAKCFDCNRTWRKWAYYGDSLFTVSLCSSY